MEDKAEGTSLSRFSILRKSWHIPHASRVESYLHSLTPGDRIIASILGVFVVVFSLSALYALERSVLVVQPAYGGTLTEGVVGSPRFINPLLALTDTDRDLATLTYAGLMGIDASGQSDSGLRPILASSYQVSADGKVYTFVLRPGAIFSDGTPVTADDVVYTVQKAQDPALKSPVLADWANIRAEVVDARTVRFTLPRAYAPFLQDTTLGILPKHLWQNVSDQDFPFAALETTPVGAGPFTESKVNRDGTGMIVSYELTASKKYAIGRPYLDGMVFKFYADSSALAKALHSGAVESAYGIHSTDDSRVVLTAPYARIFGVFFNPAQQAVLGHLEVRKALSLALDRTYIVQDLLGGYASESTGPLPAGSGIASAATSSATSTASALTGIAAAKKVLTDAGWKFDAKSSVWKKGTESLTLTLKTSSVPELKAIASAVKSDWEKLGVPVSLELSDPSTLTQQVIGPRNYGALYFGEVVGRFGDLYAFWDSAERAAPGLNVANYSNKVVDTLLERIRTTDTPSQRHADLVTVQNLIARDYPAAFTHTPDFLYTVPKSLGGVQLVQIASPSDRFAAVSSWYLQSEAVWPFLARDSHS